MQINIFFISDGTGITAESFGQSLLAQFGNIDCSKTTLPYINTEDKAIKVATELTKLYKSTGVKPVVLSTIIDPAIARILQKAPVHTHDIFDKFIPSLENIFNKKAEHLVGKKRAITESQAYDRRIESVHFALDNDDGSHTKGYDQADIIIIGVSRCGKTPTCLYLGLQFGIHAANYPLTEEDMLSFNLPKLLIPHRSKLFGLIISPERLQTIRQERRPDSQYASLKQCKMETTHVKQLFLGNKIPVINTTHYSVEEIATRILIETGIERRIK